jgi:hypothetical protein
MSEIKKLTTEELDSIKSIKQEYTNLSFALGEIELQKANLDREKQNLLNIQNQLIEKEIVLGKSLTEKYGNGSINIETGEINL